jgi:hypothetical protein
MYTTAVKTAIVEALTAGFTALNTGSPSDTSLDLTPNSITIEYPLEPVQWPAIFVQFRPTKTQWSGINPDAYSAYSTGITISGTTFSGMAGMRAGYFEGNIDLQIMAMHSEERDRLFDSVVNLILMDRISPASMAFTQSIANNNLIGMTLRLDTITPLGDSVSVGTPFSPEELTYEASIRIACIGDFYESKYQIIYPQIQSIPVSGSVSMQLYTTISGHPDNQQSY